MLPDSNLSDAARIDNEEWRAVVGFDLLYEVSSLGRVRRITGGKGARAGHILAGSKPAGHYHKVSLYSGSGVASKRYVFVHDLVAAAFLGQRPDGMWINHIDGDKHNNRPSNLEYVQPSGNSCHAYRTGLSRQKLTAEAVREIRRRLEAGETTATVASDTSLSMVTIQNIKARRTWAEV
jgi:hypothetical protein